MADDSTALTDVVEELEDASQGTDTVKVGHLIDALDQRGYGAALAVLPLMELTPLGGIPGFPTMLALLVAILVLRMFMGYEHFWAPDWLRNRSLKSKKVLKSVEWLKPISEWIDEKLHTRLAPLTGPTGRKAASIIILCTASLAVIFLGAVFETDKPLVKCGRGNRHRICVLCRVLLDIG